MPMVDGDGLLRISKCLLLVLLLQHSVWMDGDSVAEFCWQTRLRMDVGGQRQSQRQSRRPRRVRDRVRDSQRLRPRPRLGMRQTQDHRITG